MNLFAYGTLMDEEIMARAGGCRPGFQAATLLGHRRHALVGRSYPAIVAREGARVEGVCYFDLPEAALAGDPEISSIVHDSRRVEPGALFVGWRGERFDGSAFALEAAARGALAVVGEGPVPDGLAIPFIADPDPRDLLGKLAARFYRHPDRIYFQEVSGLFCIVPENRTA